VKETYLLGDLARLIGGVKNFIVKDGKVEGQSQSDGMCGRKVGRSDSTGRLVSIQSTSGTLLSGVSGLEFGKITVVVSLHFVVKDLGLFGGRVGDQRIINDAEDIVTDINKFTLDLALVVLDDFHLLGLSLLLDGGDNTPRSTARSDDILVGNRQQVALFDRELCWLLGDLLHVGDHFIEALGLFGQLGCKDTRKKAGETTKSSAAIQT
jgi:hypothetical protein